MARRLGADTADDVAAETFLAAFRSRLKFDPARGAVRPWLYVIATTLIGLHRRAERRFYHALARTPSEHVADGHENRVAAQVSAAGVGAQLAEALELKYGTVASRLNRARRKLREALGGVDPTLVAEESRA